MCSLKQHSLEIDQAHEEEILETDKQIIWIQHCMMGDMRHMPTEGEHVMSLIGRWGVCMLSGKQRDKKRVAVAAYMSPGKEIEIKRNTWWLMKAYVRSRETEKSKGAAATACMPRGQEKELYAALLVTSSWANDCREWWLGKATQTKIGICLGQLMDT